MRHWTEGLYCSLKEWKIPNTLLLHPISSFLKKPFLLLLNTRYVCVTICVSLTHLCVRACVCYDVFQSFPKDNTGYTGWIELGTEK